MQGAGEPSKLCKDIFELEKDFRYNLFLLKVRDTEIARCKTQNEHFLRELKQKEEDNSAIRIKLRETESELKSANTEKQRMRISFEETVVGLNSNLSELKKTHENYIREQRSHEKKLSVEFQERCKTLVESKEKKHQGKMAETNDRLHKEMCLTQKLKSQLQEITTENISLRNEFQEKQSHYISKISILESELKSSQEEKINEEMKLDSSKKDCAYFETELRRTITEKDQLKQELSVGDERNRNSQRKLNEISVEKDNLNHQLNTTTLELQTCLANLAKTKEEKEKLETEFEYYKRIAEQQKCTNPEHGNIDNVLKQNTVLQEVVKAMRPLELQTCLTNLAKTKEEKEKLETEFEYYKRIAEQQKCTNPEHDNIDNVLKQNTVLQEVVKAMRRERNEAFDTQEMERKMERLEGLVECLKTSMLNNLNYDADDYISSNHVEGA